MQETVIMGFLWYFVFVFSATAHEASHALTAYLLGDRTAYQGGQVTLNPVPHVQREPFGMIVFPIVTYAMGGWMMGWASCPYNPWWAQQYPRRAATMAVAGPSANLLLAILAGVLIRVGMAMGYFDAPGAIDFTHVTEPLVDGVMVKGLAAFLSIAFSLNLLLFVFNLIPLPPMDGSGVLEVALKGRALELYKSFRSHPHAALIGLFVAWYIFSPLYHPIHLLAINLLYPGVHYG
jgi:Zn-dependent protease